MHQEILQHMSIPGFQLLRSKHREKNLKSGTAAGGIAVFVKENIKHLFNVIKIDNEDTIWVKIKKEMTGEKRDVYVGTTYLKPSSGKETSNGFLKLTENIISLKNKGHVIINGGLSAKSGHLDDTIPPDKFDDEFHICIIMTTLLKETRKIKSEQTWNRACGHVQIT